MELTFLGTSSGAPTLDRNVTGLALRVDGRWDLFDCGEATQHQLLRTPLTIPKLRRVFISHLHGDHCFGLFGLLGSRSMAQTSAPLTVFGPQGLKRMLDVVLEVSSTHLTFPLDVIEVDPDGGRVVDDDDGTTIDAVPLVHRVESFAWWIREPDRPGEFDVETARTLGIPEGPAFGRLHRGESVELDGGTTIEPQQVVGPARRGRRVVIAGDNSAPDALFEWTGGADVAVHEATFTEPVLARIGDDHGHSTAARVASAASRHGVEHLVLTHFSARYENTDGASSAVGADSIDDVVSEAREHFGGGLFVASDFDCLEISENGAIR